MSSAPDRHSDWPQIPGSKHNRSNLDKGHRIRLTRPATYGHPSRAPVNHVRPASSANRFSFRKDRVDLRASLLAIASLRVPETGGSRPVSRAARASSDGRVESNNRHDRSALTVATVRCSRNDPLNQSTQADRGKRYKRNVRVDRKKWQNNRHVPASRSSNNPGNPALTKSGGQKAEVRIGAIAGAANAVIYFEPESSSGALSEPAEGSGSSADNSQAAYAIQPAVNIASRTRINGR